MQPSFVTDAIGLRPPAEHVPDTVRTLYAIEAAVNVVIRLVIVIGIVWWRADQLWPTALWWCLPVLALGVYEVFIVPGKRQRNSRWEVTDTAVYTRTGWLDQTTTIIPINRLQSVTLNQGWMSRLFGLAHVRVESAGATIGIGALNVADAQRITDHLTAVIRADEGDAT